MADRRPTIGRWGIDWLKAPLQMYFASAMDEPLPPRLAAALDRLKALDDAVDAG